MVVIVIVIVVVVLVKSDEFAVYERYAKEVISAKSRDSLNALLQRQEVLDALFVCTHLLIYALQHLFLKPIRISSF